jgi:hypothetical protein
MNMYGQLVTEFTSEIKVKAEQQGKSIAITACDHYGNHEFVCRVTHDYDGWIIEALTAKVIRIGALGKAVTVKAVANAD